MDKIQNKDELPITIARAVPADAPELARVFRQSFNAALPFIATLHTPEEDRSFFAEHLLPENEVYVARDSSLRIVGFIAFDDEWVNQLYLLAEFTGHGLGARLLGIAKSQRTRLKLWAFQRNERAKNFYAKHGFRIIEETDGAGNEENEPDALFEWPIAQSTSDVPPTAEPKAIN